MNVEDFKIKIPEGDMLKTIFNHQRDLMDRYHSIEENVVGHSVPSAPYATSDLNHRWQNAGALNVQDRASQLRFKDFAWRITEELTEATLALDEENETHYLEELIDALHFCVELLIMCGLDYDSFIEGNVTDHFEAIFALSSLMDGSKHALTYLAIEKLGEGMNRCKLKPWKQTAMLTDEKAFRQSLIEFFGCLIDLLKASGFTAKTAAQMYLNKNAVNQFRIGSAY